MKQPKKGDIVYLPCLVIGTGRYGMYYPIDMPDNVVDLRPIEATSGEPYAEHVHLPITVYIDDIVTLESRHDEDE